jgi:hypothetical protein
MIMDYSFIQLLPQDSKAIQAINPLQLFASTPAVAELRHQLLPAANIG